MQSRWLPLFSLVTFVACGPDGTNLDLQAFEQAATVSVTAVRETQPVPHSGDAADDTCVWIHPTDSALSTVIGTDKQGGIAVYSLTGAQLQYRADGDINNIDLRYDFPLGASRVALVGGTNRTSNTLQFWKVNPDRTLSGAGTFAVGSGIGDVYGFTLYHNASAGTFYAFVVDKNSGVVEQYLLDGSTGVVKGTRVRTFDNGGISEGMVADDLHQNLYVSEEDVALWRYGAEPTSGSSRVRVTSVGANATAADLEGVTIYQRSDGGGYLLVSSQGNNSFAVFNRVPPNAYLGSFRIASGTVDGVNDTDGIEVNNMNLGSPFSEGIFIAQDGSNTGGNQNHKLVSWGTIARAFSPALAIDTWDSRNGGAGGGTSCTPTTCAAQGKNCGTISDGCGGTLTCGSCSGSQTCGGGGVANVCGTASTTQTLIPANATWRYLDNGSNQGTAWRASTFDDSTWKSGVAELGYGDGDEATVVGYGTNSSAKYITTYFRRTFTVSTSFSGLTLRLKRDDGAIVYLNGTEVFRTNMPSGSVTHTTLASVAVEDATFHQAALPASLLSTGNNVLAIEIHQATASSSDISMVAELIGTPGEPTAVAPPPDTSTGADGYTLVFEDHFSGTAVDTTQWSMYNGPGHAGNGLRRPSAFSVQDGMLIITAQMIDGQIVSGGMSNKVNLTYGRFEARVRKEIDPSGAMSGVFLTWPELQDRYKYGENDIWETGPTTGTGFSTFIHYGTQQYQYRHDADHTQWHVMVMEWEPDELRIFRDGVLVWTLKDTAAIPDWAHHVCLQLDARKTVMGSTPVRMYVDYVKVYRRN